MTAPARPAPTAPARPTHRRPVLVALMVTMALSAMDNNIVATAIPQVVRDLGGFTLFSWVFSAYLLTQTVSIPVYGKLADLFGRKPILISGTAIFLIGSALCAGAWNMVSLIAFRSVQGLGAGSIMATVNTLAGDLYDLEERGRVQGWLSSVWGVSAVLGPTLGGSLAQYASWRWIFVVNLPVGAAAVALIIRFLHERVERVRHRIDVAGAVTMLIAGGTLVFGLLQGGTAWPWLSLPSLGVFAVAALATAAALMIERRAAEPIMPLWFWRRRVLAGSGLGAFGLGLLVIGPSTFLATYGQTVLGLGAIAAGGLIATMSVSWPVASAQSAMYFLRIGFRDTAAIGGVIAVAAVSAFLFVPYPVPVWVAAASTFVLGYGLGLISICTLVGPQSTVTWNQRGVVTGAVMFSRYLGQSLGAAVFGAIFNAALGARLLDAPAALKPRLPAQVSGVGAALSHPGALTSGAAAYLRAAIGAGTHAVYLALGVAAVVTVAAVMLIVPRRFATTTDSASPAGSEPAPGAASSTGSESAPGAASSTGSP